MEEKYKYLSHNDTQIPASIIAKSAPTLPPTMAATGKDACADLVVGDSISTNDLKTSLTC